MRDLTQLSITEVNCLLEQRSISAIELTDATLQRIEVTDPVVHAYVMVLAERARRAAYQADRELAQGRRRGPLHGIPVAVKDKTMTHEFAYGVNTPPTRTPWNLECYPGGSSVGSAVAVTVGSAFAAIGTDTGGSIRNPAAINGIVGLKPTYGRVSRSGVVSLGTSLDHIGPLTRTVEDCALVLQAIAGHDPADVGSVNEPVPDFRSDLETGVRGLVIGVERAHFFYDGVTDDTRQAVEAVLETLKGLGATIVTVELPELAWSPEVLMT
ncbi:MAG: amidase, partial [Thermomicrobiales bacterium]|nr:amidase [Thermomicrobiales bacterium]